MLCGSIHNQRGPDLSDNRKTILHKIENSQMKLIIEEYKIRMQVNKFNKQETNGGTEEEM